MDELSTRSLPSIFDDGDIYDLRAKTSRGLECYVAPGSRDVTLLVDPTEYNFLRYSIDY